MLLLENPLPGLIAGGSLTAMAVIAFLRSGRSVTLIIALLLAVLTMGLFAMEWLVVTPGEMIADRIHALAADLERNDPALVAEYISPRSPELQRYARQVLQHIKVKDAAVKTNLKVDVHLPQGLATAQFNSVVVIDAPRRDIVNYRHARLTTLKFRYEEGKWLISDFHEGNPLGPQADP
jgi:hypothetical protein